MSGHARWQLRRFEKWNAWLNGMKVEVMVWDGESAEMLKLFIGREFRRVRADRVAELGTGFSADRYVKPGDYVVRLAQDDHDDWNRVLVLPGDVAWVRAALGRSAVSNTSSQPGDSPEGCAQ